MALLPCLRRGNDRWWLPLSPETTDVLGRVMLASTASPPNRTLSALVVDSLCNDPPLLIYAALNWPGETATIDELADWLIDHLVARFASGDAFLAAPEIEPALTHRWSQLRDHFRTVPRERWLDEAVLWLETAGPAIPDSWRQQWPILQLDGDCDDLRSAGLADPGMLHQLARNVQHRQMLDEAFDQQLRVNKLAAIEQLAYGLSHEINNPLANISTRAQQLQRGESDATRHAVLQRIVDQVFRAHEMIADLMFYANPPPPNLQTCQLGPIVMEVAETFREMTERQSIRLDLQVPEDPVEVQADRDMIAEAVRVLVRNSVEAIGAQGTIVVSVAEEAQGPVIHVADSGPGLSEMDRQHAFDPY